MYSILYEQHLQHKYVNIIILYYYYEYLYFNEYVEQ